VCSSDLLAFFMLGAGQNESPWQRNLVADQIAEATEPTILTGDFNEHRHEILVQQFGEAGFSTVQDKEITWRRRPFVLDHIFYNAPLRVVGYQVLPSPASDHHAVVADFEFVD
jgi:endonuclease/exonuclease/phosphatase (EEP) superfamily protein YafD